MNKWLRKKITSGFKVETGSEDLSRRRGRRYIEQVQVDGKAE